MGTMVRICFQCRELMEDSFILTPCLPEEYDKPEKDRCDNCRKRGRPLVVYRVEPKRRAVKD